MLTPNNYSEVRGRYMGSFDLYGGYLLLPILLNETYCLLLLLIIGEHNEVPHLKQYNQYNSYSLVILIYLDSILVYISL